VPTEAARQADEIEPIRIALVRMGLIESSFHPVMTPLAGGVSSIILRVDRPGEEALCVKRALARLKVAAEWRAPVERNHAEAEWLRAVGQIAPSCVPAVLGEDRAAGLFVMPYLAHGRYPVWKELLREGRVHPEFAEQVGATLAAIHAATAGDALIAARFKNDAIFQAIRLEPYLLATGEAHPDLAPALGALARATASTHRALIHGDVSPKNILVGSRGPVFIDAECACYGDPAFDLAFCLNHLLLKCLWRPQHVTDYLGMFDRLTERYFARANWEPFPELTRRVAHLLPALMLARIDGKSPVEYLTEEPDREQVRAFAMPLIREPVSQLAPIRAGWAREFGL